MEVNQNTIDTLTALLQKQNEQGDRLLDYIATRDQEFLDFMKERDQFAIRHAKRNEAVLDLSPEDLVRHELVGKIYTEALSSASYAYKIKEPEEFNKHVNRAVRALCEIRFNEGELSLDELASRGGPFHDDELRAIAAGDDVA